jgi:hypothetical protein
MAERGGLSEAQGAPVMHPPAAAHTDAPARSAGQRHRHQDAASSTSAAESTGVKPGSGVSAGVSAGVSLPLTTSLLG